MVGVREDQPSWVLLFKVPLARVLLARTMWAGQNLSQAES